MLKVFQLGLRKSDIARIAPGKIGRNTHKLLWLRIRKWAEQCGVYNTENRSCSSDTQRNGQDGNSAETGRFFQHTSRIFSVLRYLFYQSAAFDLVYLFPDPDFIAEGEERPASRFFGR